MREPVRRALVQLSGRLPGHAVLRNLYGGSDWVWYAAPVPRRLVRLTMQQSLFSAPHLHERPGRVPARDPVLPEHVAGPRLRDLQLTSRRYGASRVLAVHSPRSTLRFSCSRGPRSAWHAAFYALASQPPLARFASSTTPLGAPRVERPCPRTPPSRRGRGTRAWRTFRRPGSCRVSAGASRAAVRNGTRPDPRPLVARSGP
jgi:hypothetical protein